jgi:DNA-binding NarL/FixJ family response regulator
VTIRVFLVDDQELVRAGFRMVVDSQPDMEVVGEAGDGGEALEKLAVTKTDVVLMDVRMPRLDGVEATRRVRAQAMARSAVQSGARSAAQPAVPSAAQTVVPSEAQAVAGGDDGAPRVVVLTTFDLDEYAFAALKAGASGFLLKDAPPADLLSAIRSVCTGDAVVAPSTTRRLLERFVHHLPDPSPPAVHDGLAALTGREREVLLTVARGLSNAEIAGELYLSEATVKTHVGRVLAKLGLRDRVQLVVFAYESGLVGRGATS